MRYRRAVALSAALVALSWAAPAFAGDWIVARVSGSGWIVSRTTAPVAIAAGMAVPLGATVATGPDGRAMLVNGRDSMMLGPGTVIAVPYKPDRGLKTTVYQQIGTVDLNVEKRRSPHFSVQTPYLAAVVKGTEFTVDVSATDAEVSVSRGLVAVADLESGDRSDIGPGQTASASPEKGGGLAAAGANGGPEVRAGRPQAPALASPGQTLSSAQPGNNNGNSAAAGAGNRGSDLGNNGNDRGEGRSANANNSNGGGDNKAKGGSSGNNANNGNNGNNGEDKSAGGGNAGGGSGSSGNVGGGSGNAGGGNGTGGVGPSAGGGSQGGGSSNGGGGGSDDDDDDNDDGDDDDDDD